ncbi:MAG: hypothetical protein HUN04_18190 [Desulfobacter sp.]|nr:MAG: hypothetical protein HUN04_18190 [Desulfobacter sp.]
MKWNRRKMINRSPDDRRQNLGTSWKGDERRGACEKREKWERVSTWSSIHKPLILGEFNGAHQFLP